MKGNWKEFLKAKAVPLIIFLVLISLNIAIYMQSTAPSDSGIPFPFISKFMIKAEGGKEYFDINFSNLIIDLGVWCILSCLAAYLIVKFRGSSK